MLKILSLKTEDISKGAILLAFFTLLSQVLALFRESVFSRVVGAGVDMDIYNLSFRITDIVFIASATLISTFVLIPILNRKEKKDNESFQRNVKNSHYKNYINRVFTTFSFYIAILVALFFIFMPFFIDKFFPIYEGEVLEKFISITRLALVAPFLMAIGNIFISINQTKHYFLPYALMSILNNLTIITATYFLYPIYGVKGMIFGVIAGAFLYLIVHFPTVLKEGLFPRLSSFLSWKEIIKIFSISLPRTVGIFAFTLMLIYISARVTLLGDGFVTFFTWAMTLASVPSGFLGMAYSVAAFPKLSKLYISNRLEEFSFELSKIFRSIIFFGIPITLFFIIFSKDLVALVYASNNLSEKSLFLISGAMALLALSVVFQSLNFVLTRAFFATEDTKTPFVMNILALISLVLFGNLIFGGKVAEALYRSEYLINIPDQLSTEWKFFLISAAYSFAFLFLSTGLFLILKKKIPSVKVLKNTGIKRKTLVNLFTFVPVYFLYNFFSKRYLLEVSQLNAFIKMAIFGILILILMNVFSNIFREYDFINLRKSILKKVFRKQN